MVTRVREVEKMRGKAKKESKRRAELKKEVKIRKHTLVQVKAFLDEARPQNVAYNVGHKCKHCGNYYQTAEHRDRHVARRHGAGAAKHGQPGSDESSRRLKDLEVRPPPTPPFVLPWREPPQGKCSHVLRVVGARRRCNISGSWRRLKKPHAHVKCSAWRTKCSACDKRRRNQPRAPRLQPWTKTSCASCSKPWMTRTDALRSVRRRCVAG